MADMEKLAQAIRDAYLEMCLAGECNCVTREEHEQNITRAKEMGLTQK